MFYVYVHHKPDGTPFYVGKGSGERSHSFVKNRNQHHMRIINKCGRENVLVSIIPCPSEVDAFSQEVQLIKSFRDLGYELANKTDGGEGCSPSDETRAKMSAVKKGHKHSAETRAKMSAAKKGRLLPPEHRAKLSEARKGNTNARGLKGRQQSPEHRRKRALARTGMKYSKGLDKCL
jgi:hypothetical protein